MSIRRWLLKVCERVLPRRGLEISAADLLPARMPRRSLVLVRDGDEDWSVGMRCPCGCGDVIELPLQPDVRPRWKLEADLSGRPTLSPSVWRRTGCGSHFWVKRGRVFWCP
jgi:hypothetical protein